MLTATAGVGIPQGGAMPQPGYGAPQPGFMPPQPGYPGGPGYGMWDLTNESAADFNLSNESAAGINLSNESAAGYY